MDRFKFRFWNTLRNKYEDIYCVGSNGITLDYVIPEQCTGLKDKNGKLIYEGDELKDWKNNPFIIVFDEEYAQFVAKDERGWVSNIERDALEDCEIIGNIHENPDLLGENND